MQKSDFNKVALHHLLPGPRPWIRAQKNLTHEKLGKQLDAKKKKKKKKKGRPHSMICYNTKFLQEKTCKQTI